MPAWPATLPVTPFADSFAPAPPPLVLRSDTESGPAFQRRIATAGPWTFPGLRFRLDAAQVATFQAFWTGDITDGAASFDFDVPAHWPVPQAGTTATARIIAPYALTPRARGTHWVLTVDLELLP